MKWVKNKFENDCILVVMWLPRSLFSENITCAGNVGLLYNNYLFVSSCKNFAFAFNWGRTPWYV